VRKWFQKQNINFFKDGFQKLVQPWRKCIEVRGDFVAYAAFKIIDVDIFFKLKYLFPFIFFFIGGKTYQPALVYICILAYIYSISLLFN